MIKKGILSLTNWLSTALKWTSPLCYGIALILVLSGSLTACGGSGGGGDSTASASAADPKPLPKWEWMSGSDTVGNKGSYGAKGISDPSNLPPARNRAVSWTDNNGNLWLFGGIENYIPISGVYQAPDELNDLWEYNVTTNQWTWFAGSPKPNQAGIYGTKGVAAADNTPGPRNSASTWVDATGNLWLFGGGGIDAHGNIGELNDLWKYDISTHMWTWISGSDSANDSGLHGDIFVPSSTYSPEAKSNAYSWVGPHGLLWLYGGSSDTGDNYGDRWVFDPITNQWAWAGGPLSASKKMVYSAVGKAAPENTPGARYDAATWGDKEGNFWLFGGAGYLTDGTYNSMNDLWKFDVQSGEWTLVRANQPSHMEGSNVFGSLGISGPQNTPGTLSASVTWTDKKDNLWIFGGEGIGDIEGETWGDLNEIWKYNPRNNTWTWMGGEQISNPVGIYGTQDQPQDTNQAGGREYVAAWTDPYGNFWLFGGRGYGTKPTEGNLNDLWKIIVPY